MSRPVSPGTRAAAIADYNQSRDPYSVVAARHGVSSSTMHSWINPRKNTRGGGFSWRDEEVALTGGRWVNVRGVMRWEQNEAAKVETVADLVACPTCGAKLSEPCRTGSGNATRHVDRVLPRRCPCGNPMQPGSFFCTSECRSQARAATYERREKRNPTRERRAA